jgi:hypothetical protein
MDGATLKPRLVVLSCSVKVIGACLFNFGVGAEGIPVKLSVIVLVNNPPPPGELSLEGLDVCLVPVVLVSNAVGDRKSVV